MSRWTTYRERSPETLSLTNPAHHCVCVWVWVITQLSPIAMVTGYKYPWQLTDKGVVDKEQAVQCDTDHEH